MLGGSGIVGVVVSVAVSVIGGLVCVADGSSIKISVLEGVGEAGSSVGVGRQEPQMRTRIMAAKTWNEEGGLGMSARISWRTHYFSSELLSAPVRWHSPQE